MNERHRMAFEGELALARDLMRHGNYSEAFARLQRAHVLGQDHVRPHVRSHWHMLRVELHRRNPMAVVGQAARIVLGGLGSLLGKVPTGNTGGTNVSMFQKMPIDPELSKIMR